MGYVMSDLQNKLDAMRVARIVVKRDLEERLGVYDGDDDSWKDAFDKIAELKFERHVRETLVPKIRDSHVFVSIVPTGKTDVKFAVELGLGIMYNKPIIGVVQTGAEIPEKLSRVVDRFVEMDLNGSNSDLSERLGNAITELMGNK